MNGNLSKHHEGVLFIQVTTYKTIHALTREGQRATEGTLAYVSERGGELYIRARNGWRKIQVCIVCADRYEYVWSDVWTFPLFSLS